MKMMTAAVLYGKQDIHIEQVEKPTASQGQAVVLVKAVGICGSDIHYYEHFGMGESYKLTKPQILGHEASGVVVEVGENVTNVKVGDRVAIEPGETCFKCEQCKTGRYNLCPDVHFLSTPFEKGAFAEYLIMGSDMLFKIPDRMSFVDACLAEPLSVGIHACELACVRPGKKLLIIGAGPIGLMALVAAKAFGVTDITVCDIQDNRLEFAQKECGAKNIANTKVLSTKEIKNAFADGVGFDCIIETAGSPITDYMTIEIARKGAYISLVGIPKEPDVQMNVFDIIDKELTVRGVFRYTNSYPTAIGILDSGIIDFKKIVTNQFDLKETDKALNYAMTQKMNSIKTVVTNFGE